MNTTHAFKSSWIGLSTVVLLACNGPTVPTATGVETPDPTDTPTVASQPTEVVCGVVEDGSDWVPDPCTAWFSIAEGHALGVDLEVAQVAGNDVLLLGGNCENTDALSCRPGIFYVTDTAYDLVNPNVASGFIQFELAGRMGIGMTAVGPVADDDVPQLAAVGFGGLFLLPIEGSGRRTVEGDLFRLSSFRGAGRYNDRCGDVTGDGVEDLCVGAGLTEIYAGPVAIGDEPIATFEGQVQPAESMVAGVFEPAGAAQVVIGFPGYGGVASYPVGSGATSVPASATTNYGSSSRLLYRADIDDDGDSDLMVSGDGTLVIRTDDAGAFDGASTTFMGPGQGFGEAVRVGDLNGDGVSDLVVGDPGAGRVYVVPGPILSASLSDATVWSSPCAGGGRFGASVEFADVDGTGTRSLYVGAPGCDGLRDGVGAVFHIESPIR